MTANESSLHATSPYVGQLVTLIAGEEARQGPSLEGYVWRVLAVNATHVQIEGAVNKLRYILRRNHWRFHDASGFSVPGEPEPTPESIDGWVNIYEFARPSFHPTRERADFDNLVTRYSNFGGRVDIMAPGGDNQGRIRCCALFSDRASADKWATPNIIACKKISFTFVEGEGLDGDTAGD